MENILELNKINKKLGHRTILSNISFELAENKLLGLIGNNGAGKTTLIKLIVGLLQEDSGLISLYGQNAYTLNDEAKLKIGVAFDSPCFMNDLDALNNLIYFSNYYKMNITQTKARFKELSSIFNFDPGTKKISEYSKGMAQKLNLIRALLHQPELLILDEPFSGLDVQAQVELKNIILNLKAVAKFTLIISSHNLHHLDDIIDDVIMLENGKIKFYKSICELSKTYDLIYGLSFSAGTIKLEIEKLKLLQGIQINSIDGDNCEIQVTEKNIENVMVLLSKNLIFPQECSRKRNDLESIMLHYKEGHI